jgi:single-strand DNA-binding protein
MYQKLILIGRLGRDPEMRYTSQGTPVTNFSVATDRVWNDQSGQRQERTVWFRVSAWGRLAETCNQYLSKGRLVMVEGELQEPTPYQSRDGEWRASLDVMARNVQFLGGRGDGGGGGGGGGYEQGSRTSDARSDGPDTILDEEEIPF